MNRCTWCEKDDLYRDYHDNEWGRLVTDDKIMFEFLVLESAQAGLSWYTILKRRSAYKKAFKNFDVKKVAKMTEIDVKDLLEDKKTELPIIKNKLKITATITNAIHFLGVQKEFGSFCDYLWNFFPEENRKKKKPIINIPKSTKEIAATSSLSDAISKDMKKRGFKFFGSTICYAHLQACGYIDDHMEGCFRKKKK